MPLLSGIEVAETINRSFLKTKVIIITTFDRVGYLSRAHRAQVSGYLLKDTQSDTLIDTIRRIATGERYFYKSVEDIYTHDPLNNKERKILRLIEKGLTNKEIAELFHLSSGTIRNYLCVIMEKLHATNRIEAFTFARENGWL